MVATAETPEQALALADEAAQKLVVHTARNSSVGGNVRVLVPAAVALLAAAAAAIALFAFQGGIGPRLVSDTIRARGALVQVRYVFNEPVRALLLVNGRRAAGPPSRGNRGAPRRGRGANRRRVPNPSQGPDPPRPRPL